MQPFYNYQPNTYQSNTYQPTTYQPYQTQFNARQGQGQANYQYPNQTPFTMQMTNFGGNSQPIVAYVNGVEGAKGYILYPNQTAILFDSDNKEKFYLKNADANGVPTLEKYIKIKEEDVPKQEETGYVSKKEFDELKSQFEKNIGDLQKLLQQPSVLKKGE